MSAANSEPAHPDPARADPARADPARADPARAEPVEAPGRPVAAASPRPSGGTWVILAIAAACHALADGTHAIPFFAWLTPIFLLRFARARRPLAGWALTYAAWVAVGLVMLRGFIPAPGPVFYVLVPAISIPMTLPYLFDRLVAPRLGGWLSTLAFPFALVAVDLFNAFGPYGTMPTVAASQDFLPLLQLASVTGMWGITFLIGWTAAMVNAAWEHGFELRRAGRPLAIWASVLGAVLAFGAARLAFFPPSGDRVRVAAITVDPAAKSGWELITKVLRGGTLGPEELAEQSRIGREQIARLLERTREQGLAGAKVAYWSEAAAAIPAADEPWAIEQAAAVARERSMYVGMAIAVLYAGRTHPLDNEILLIAPSGEVQGRYEKSRPVPMVEGTTRPGDGVVPVMNAPWGKLSNVICFDQDFAGLMRQAGGEGVDVMFAPVGDWPAFTAAHVRSNVLRAVENGFSLVRPTARGYSVLADYQGRIVGWHDFFGSTVPALVGEVPAHGVRTIYARIGDAFAWACVLSLVALAVLARRRNEH